jgi:hypothetical protein
MMVSQMFDLYVLPTGRRAFALRGVIDAAKDGGHKDLEKAARALLTREGQVAAMEAAWATAAVTNKAVESAELRELDADVDRLVTGVRTTGEARLRALPRALRKARGPAIQAFLSKYYPNGAQAITNQSYPEEYEAVLAMVKSMRAHDAALVGALGLAPYLDDLEAVLPAYLAAIKASGKTATAVAYKELLASRAEAHEAYCLLVAKVLVGVEATAARDALLEPVVAQQEAMRAYYSRRAVVQDVDGETGEPVVTPSVPAAPAAPDGA